MIHFFGLLLDGRTAQDLAFSEFLDLSQVRIMMVAGLDGGYIHYLCPRGTITKGLFPLALPDIGKKRLQRMKDALTEKCVDHVRKTLGDEYRSLYVEGERMYSPILACIKPETGWYTFMEEDVEDVTSWAITA